MSAFLNFAETEQQIMLRDTLRRYLASKCPPAVVRDVLEGRADYARALWRDLGAMQCLGASIPEADGGAGLGLPEASVVAEELGRVLAPVPSLSSLYQFADLITNAGDAAQRREILPLVLRGESVGTLAHIELSPKGRIAPPAAYLADGRLYGVKDIVPDGIVADVAVVLAREGLDDPQNLSLFVAPLQSVLRTPIDTIDPTRPHAQLRFEGVPVSRLGAAGQGKALIDGCFKRAALLVAFEQIGGAEAVLHRACDYARGRYAFGRPIGSFQAVKQLLADMYVSLRIAQANAAYAVFAFETGAPDRDLAAARAHLSATRAFRHCASDAIQVHGGAGFMWEVDMHLYFRRAETLAQCLGGPAAWSEKLVSALRREECAHG